MKDEFSPYVREAVVLEDRGFLTVREFAAIVAEAMWPSASDAGKRQVTQKAWEKRLSEEIRDGAVTAHNQITKMPIDPPAAGMAWGFDIGPERLLDTLLSTTEARRIAEQSGINVTFSDQADLADELQAARNRIAELEAELAVMKAAPAKTVNAGQITGATYDRLLKAVSAFPTQYPDYKTRPPKLDDDVRVWLEKANISTNAREKHLFGVVIAEHFDF